MQSLKLKREINGSEQEHPEKALTLNNLGDAFMRKGSYECAI